MFPKQILHHNHGTKIVKNQRESKLMHPQKIIHYSDIAFILLFHFLNPYPIFFGKTPTHAVSRIPSVMRESFW